MYPVSSHSLRPQVIDATAADAAPSALGSAPSAPQTPPPQQAPQRNVMPGRLIQQQLLRQTSYPAHVNRLVAQLVCGKDREAADSPEEIILVARHIDMNRRAGRQALPLPALRALHGVAEDANHPLQHDARLVLAIALADSVAPLHEQLAVYFKRDFELDDDIPPQPASRIYNSHLPSIALRAQDYGTVGRTLMTQGATHLLRNDQQPDRERHLSSTMWSLEKCPQEHPLRKTLSEFFKQPDLLDELGVYEL